MICRLWRGVTPLEKGNEYVEYIRETGVDGCLSTPGNQGVMVLRQNDADRSRFMFISLWQSMRAIEGFAGRDVNKAVFYPEDHQYLIDSNPVVEHFEMVIGTAPDGERRDSPFSDISPQGVRW